jgi:hypothetical protein
MREQRWALRTILFLAIVVSYALGFVPGAKDFGQFQDFDFSNVSGALQTTLGLVLVSGFLIGAAFGAKGFWPVTMALVSLRTLFDLWVAFDDPHAALGWAASGASLIMVLALWSLRPVDEPRRQSDPTDVRTDARGDR